MFAFFKNRRRAKLRSRPFPDEWLEIIVQRVPYYALLPETDREELQGHVQILIEEKHFEGCAGFEITDEVRVMVAAHAAILLLHRATDYFPKLRTILVYPEAFSVEETTYDEDGIAEVDSDVHAGESWESGAVVLAWEEVVLGCARKNDGFNVVLHEFAHQLDQQDGLTDGAPSGLDRTLWREWAEVMGESFEKLQRDVQRRRRTLIDDYGATNPAEFFAVATETFFEQPIPMRRRHPELYQTLKTFYAQDPASLYRQV